MSGPPTPPPSSALEREDASRKVVPPEQPPAAPPEDTLPPQSAATAATHPPLPAQLASASNSYRDVFTFTTILGAQDHFAELVLAAETSDLNARDDTHPERLLVIVPLVLSYLILDDTPPAVHALTRLPRNLAVAPLSLALFKLVASVSERKYQNVYARAAQVHDAAQGPETIDDLKPVVAGLLEKFLDRFRRNTFILLSRAYTSVPLPLVQSYLSLPAEQVLSVAAEYRWKYDSSTQILSPVPIVGAKDSATTRNSFGQSTLATFNLVASISLE
ncbi:hypothetical protein BDW22DRAFT_1426966 [Trametopsis cervina]|nr:hypothetical protein BDW22DRAFT_1426966 [Trametopsis cervina]